MGVGGGMAWVSDFFTKNPNLKKKEKIYSLFSVLGGGGGEVIFLRRI